MGVRTLRDKLMGNGEYRIGLNSLFASLTVNGNYITDAMQH
jgi:hypothetical protein